MRPNPVGCQRFVVNMFKAGSGKCRDCGHDWFLHEGAIDREILLKYQALSRSVSPTASIAPLKTARDLKEEKKKLLIQQAKEARRGSRSNEDAWLHGDQRRPGSMSDVSAGHSEDDDDFKFSIDDLGDQNISTISLDEVELKECMNSLLTASID